MPAYSPTAIHDGRVFACPGVVMTIPTPRTEDEVRLDLARLERERQQAKDLIRAIDVAINRDLDELRAR